MRLSDKVAVITGAAKGIGRATAETFLREGALVVAADLGPAEGLGPGDRVSTVVGNVASREGAERIVHAAIERFGRVDVLVNNAGILDAFLPVGELTDEVWERVLAVNLSGPMYTSRAALPAMLERRSGVIINVSSVGGLFGARAGAAYTASKHGLIGLTRNIAATYARDGIRCVAVCPGGVNTGIGLGGGPSERGYAALKGTLATSIRLAEPAEMASLLLFLASDDSSALNGAVIVADGGWTAA